MAPLAVEDVEADVEVGIAVFFPQARFDGVRPNATEGFHARILRMHPPLHAPRRRSTSDLESPRAPPSIPLRTLRPGALSPCRVGGRRSPAESPAPRARAFRADSRGRDQPSRLQRGGPASAGARDFVDARGRARGPARRRGERHRKARRPGSESSAPSLRLPRRLGTRRRKLRRAGRVGRGDRGRPVSRGKRDRDSPSARGRDLHERREREDRQPRDGGRARGPGARASEPWREERRRRNLVSRRRSRAHRGGAAEAGRSLRLSGAPRRAGGGPRPARRRRRRRRGNRRHRALERPGRRIREPRGHHPHGREAGRAPHRLPARRRREPRRHRDRGAPGGDGGEDRGLPRSPERHSRPGGAHSRDPRSRHGEDREAEGSDRGRSPADRRRQRDLGELREVLRKPRRSRRRSAAGSDPELRRRPWACRRSPFRAAPVTTPRASRSSPPWA